MDTRSERKMYTVIPEGEHRCVWMNAGLLAYQICDHPSDCDSCPLDGAMRRHFARSDRAVEQGGPVYGSGRAESLRDGFGYHANHCWQREIGGTTVRVGLEPALASALLVPKSVVLPSAGQHIKAGQPCVWIIMEDGTFPVSAIADGEVTAQNSAVTREPQEVFLHPFERGWLYEFTPDAARPRPMDLGSAEKCYALDMARFQKLLADELTPGTAAVGLTLADGGKPLRDVSAVLGSRRYCAVVREAFTSKPA